jgi:uncharacterized protein
MHYTWDEKKRESNLKKHSLDFEDAPDVFDGLTVSYGDNRFDYEELRFITIGWLDASLVTLVHTETEHEIRIISFRKATRREEKIYFANLPH